MRGRGALLAVLAAGVLQVLEDEGIPVDRIAGTSMGACVGALYASGYSAPELTTITEDIDWARIFRGRAERRFEPVTWRVDVIEVASTPSLRPRRRPRSSSPRSRSAASIACRSGWSGTVAQGSGRLVADTLDDRFFSSRGLRLAVPGRDREELWGHWAAAAGLGVGGSLGLVHLTPVGPMAVSLGAGAGKLQVSVSLGFQ